MPAYHCRFRHQPPFSGGSAPVNRPALSFRSRSNHARTKAAIGAFRLKDLEHHHARFRKAVVNPGNPRNRTDENPTVGPEAPSAPVNPLRQRRIRCSREIKPPQAAVANACETVHDALDVAIAAGVNCACPKAPCPSPSRSKKALRSSPAFCPAGLGTGTVPVVERALEALPVVQPITTTGFAGRSRSVVVQGSTCRSRPRGRCPVPSSSERASNAARKAVR